MNFLTEGEAGKIVDGGTEKIIKALGFWFGQIFDWAKQGTEPFLGYLGDHAIFLFAFAVFFIVMGIGAIHKLIKGW